MTDDPADQIRALDARSLRGLAHPLRMRMIAALREFGPATASQLADRMGESSGATSYHLRQLAAYGFIEDDPERGVGRERWWKVRYRGTRFDNVEDFLQHPDPTVRGAMSTFLYEHAAAHAEQVSTWLGTMHEWPQAWQSTWDMSDWTLRLTPELAEQMINEAGALIESYRERLAEAEAKAGAAAESAAEAAGPDAPDSAPGDGETAGPAMVRIHLHAFPRSDA